MPVPASSVTYSPRYTGDVAIVERMAEADVLERRALAASPSDLPVRP